MCNGAQQEAFEFADDELVADDEAVAADGVEIP
jgi:hypothetical protein